MLHVSFPASLKKVLVADWERVSKEGEVLQLPHKHPVKSILEAHVEAHEPKTERETVGAVVGSLRQYFDQALPQVLLYQQEVAQSKRLLKHDKPASEVYGPEHLLRLLGVYARPMACSVAFASLSLLCEQVVARLRCARKPSLRFVASHGRYPLLRAGVILAAYVVLRS